MQPRLTCTPLEDRLTPALSVFNLDGSLLIVGTPEAGPSEMLSVSRTTSDLDKETAVGLCPSCDRTLLAGNLYQVRDGDRDLGAFRVTRGITLSLDSFDNDIQVDLNGGTLRGDVTIDLGTGDRNRATRNRAVLLGGGGTVNGSVAFRGSSSNESMLIGARFSFDFLNASPVTVRGDVTAIGREVAEPFEDSFELGAGSTVHGSLFTHRVTYTQIYSGTVNRDVTALTHVPGGMGLIVFGGTIGGDLYAEGSATAPGYVSFGLLEFATIRGNATIRITNGYAVNFLSATTIGKNFVYTAEGDVEGGVEISNGTRVDGSAVFDLNTTAGMLNELYLSGTVGGSLVVNDRDGDLNVIAGLEYSGGLTVQDGITINAGGGTNSFAFDGASGSKAGGPVVYSGGSGADTVTITGSENNFDLFVFVGGGDDTVAFAPDAKVKSALIVFGRGGTNTWTPPDEISFPLTLIGL